MGCGSSAVKEGSVVEIKPASSDDKELKPADDNKASTPATTHHTATVAPSSQPPADTAIQESAKPPDNPLNPSSSSQQTKVQTSASSSPSTSTPRSDVSGVSSDEAVEHLNDKSAPAPAPAPVPPAAAPMTAFAAKPSPAPSRAKKGEIVQIDVFANPAPLGETAKQSALRERLEASKKKSGDDLAPISSANIEKRLAEAEERRQQQSTMRVSKARATNEHVRGKAETLREAEERKTQELMDLIKNKSRAASASRQAKRAEVVQKAEGEVQKAKDLSKAKKEGMITPDGTTPPETPHGNSLANTTRPSSGVSSGASSSSDLLNTPLPPMSMTGSR